MEVCIAFNSHRSALREFLEGPPSLGGQATTMVEHAKSQVKSLQRALQTIQELGIEPSDRMAIYNAHKSEAGSDFSNLDQFLCDLQAFKRHVGSFNVMDSISHGVEGVQILRT